MALPVVCACQGALGSLGPQDAQSSGESTGSEPVLVRLAVCRAAVPLAQDLTAALATDDSRLLFDLMPTNSQIALELLLAGQADLAIVGREIDLDALSGERSDGRGFRSEVLATNAIGVIVHRDSPLRGLSIAELAALFGGYYLDWEELEAGSGRPEIVCREQGAASRVVFGEMVMGGSPVSSSAIVMPHDQAVVEYVAQHPRAIGYASAVHADDRMRLVPIEGALPTLKEIRRGEYPLTHPLVLLVSPDAPREASRLANFCRSSRGRRIIERRYVVPR